MLIKTGYLNLLRGYEIFVLTSWINNTFKNYNLNYILW